MSNDATNRWSKTRAIAAAVTATTLLTPQIMRHAAKAQAARDGEQAAQLQFAIEKTEQLLAKLRLVQLAYGWHDKDVA